MLVQKMQEGLMNGDDQWNAESICADLHEDSCESACRAEHSVENIPVTPTTSMFSQKYCDANGMCIVMQMRGILRYK